MSFEFYQPVRIVFGAKSADQIGQLAAGYGKRVLLVTVKEFPAVSALYRRVTENLRAAGLEVTHFDGVIPNPTTDVVTQGATLAKANRCDVVVGLGGGSSMDTAKAIAVEASHPGTAWDYLHYKTPPTEKTLPVVAVTTTSGTGSQVTQCAVITHTATKDKSAIWHEHIFPKTAVIDPELMLTLPKEITAHTGFDAFAHCFEAYISAGATPLTDAWALEGIRLITANLPKALENPGDLEARTALALGDTLGGMCISAAGVTLPHGLGMQISGHCPWVTHGQSLAATYPEFTRYTYAAATEKFARAGRLLSKALEPLTDAEAAEQCCGEIDRFMRTCGMWFGFDELGVTDADLREIADCGQVLGDYKNNPRVASVAEMYDLLIRCKHR